MKKLSLLVFAAFACIALASTASAEIVTPGFDIEQVSTLQALGFETPSWLIDTGMAPRPRPNPHNNFPYYCPDFNNTWCTYQYDGGCCCVGTSTIPNTYCPSYCI